MRTTRSHRNSPRGPARRAPRKGGCAGRPARGIGGRSPSTIRQAHLCVEFPQAARRAWRVDSRPRNVVRELPHLYLCILEGNVEAVRLAPSRREYALGCFLKHLQGSGIGSIIVPINFASCCPPVVSLFQTLAFLPPAVSPVSACFVPFFVCLTCLFPLPNLSRCLTGFLAIQGRIARKGGEARKVVVCRTIKTHKKWPAKH